MRRCRECERCRDHFALEPEALNCDQQCDCAVVEQRQMRYLEDFPHLLLKYVVLRAAIAQPFRVPDFLETTCKRIKFWENWSCHVDRVFGLHGHISQSPL